MKPALWLSATLLAFGTHATSLAAIVTLDLSSPYQYGGATDNLVINGFRVSPRCHFDYLTRGVGSNTVSGLGTDFAGNCEGGQPPPPFPPSYNPNYLGASLGSLKLMGYIDYQGAPFDLLSLDFYRTEYAAIASSNGGFIEFPFNGALADQVYQLTFSGPQWENLSWVTFNPGNGAGQPSGVMGNFRLRVADNTVPEPGSSALIAAGLVLIVRANRRRCGVGYHPA